MAKFEIGKERIYNPYWKSQGLEDIVLWDVVPVRNHQKFALTFEAVNTERQQGVWLRTDKGIIINERLCPSVVLWSHSAPRDVIGECLTDDGHLNLYNVWSEANENEVKRSQGHTSGMRVEPIADGWRYRCLDRGFEPEFDKLIVALRLQDPDDGRAGA